MARCPADFVLVADGAEIPASFHGMAAWCQTLSALRVCPPRFVVPEAGRQAVETFRDCVPLLWGDKAIVKEKLKTANLAAVRGLCDFFVCPALAEICDELAQSHEDIGIDMLITQLSEALKANKIDMCSITEERLALNLGPALARLQNVPLEQVPVACLLRILEKGLALNPDVDESVLCDFILAKIHEDESCCFLAEFLRIARLPAAKAGELLQCEALDRFYARGVPFHFLRDLFRTFDRRITDLRQQLTARQNAVVTETTARIEQLSGRLQQVSSMIRARRYRTVCRAELGDNPLHGVIEYLRNEGRLNCVQVTSSQAYHEFVCGNILDFASNTAFFSRQAEGAFFCVKFVGYAVIPSHYTLRSGPWDIHGPHPKSWVLEASGDGATWSELDRRTDSEDLNGQLRVHTYEPRIATNCPFSFFRVKSIGQCHDGRLVMSCSAFELFGELVAPLD